MAEDKEKNGISIPRRLFNPATLTSYRCHRLLWKGSFAKCYEIIDEETDDVSMAKIVCKKLAMQHNELYVATDEIAIHRSLHHRNVVALYGHYEDSRNIYIILALCEHGSLEQLLQHRKAVTEYEGHFFIPQIIVAFKYLHLNKIVHRDLNLRNILLYEHLHVKISEFGMATRFQRGGEHTKTISGQPIFPAPEIRAGTAHSFAVDIWAIGCVMYWLLVGSSPKEVRIKIKNNDFKIASILRPPAVAMLYAMLKSNPNERPTSDELLRFEFVRNFPVPYSLPSAWLTTAPTIGELSTLEAEMEERRTLPEADPLPLHDPITVSAPVCYPNEDFRAAIKTLYGQLSTLIKSKPKLIDVPVSTTTTNTCAWPLYWIVFWFDDSSKHGFGYKMCDESIGVMFNDTTKLILLANQTDVHFVDRIGKKTYMTLTDYPKTLKRKMGLLVRFKHRMRMRVTKLPTNDVKAKGKGKGDQLSEIPHLNSWYRTACATVMHLTNGLVQMNFVSSFTNRKIQLCPEKGTVTCTDHHGLFQTYRFSKIITHGCSAPMYRMLLFAHDNIARMFQKMYF